RGVDVAQRLLEIDDVDAVALREDEALHLGVPTTGLVSEVDAAVEQLAHGDDGHADDSFHVRPASAGLRTSVRLGTAPVRARPSARGGQQVRAGGIRFSVSGFCLASASPTGEHVLAPSAGNG